MISCFFFFNDTATTEIYTLSLHDALPISFPAGSCVRDLRRASRSFTSRALSIVSAMPIPRAAAWDMGIALTIENARDVRSEEHTSELQSLTNLVCRLLLATKHITASSHHG